MWVALWLAAVASADSDEDGDGFKPAEGDCNDHDDTIYPGAPEGCDGVDNDCDGYPAPEELDDDGDGLAECEGDCDDAIAAVVPGAPEVCNGLDDDCDGDIDDGNPGGGEVCDEHRCVPGETRCVDGEIECVGGADARDEICNCEDDDCDDLVDEGEDICPPGARCLDCACRLPCIDQGSNDAAFLLVVENGQVIGRVAILENRRFNAFNDRKAATFYLFECENTLEAATSMFEYGAEWARKRGLEG